MLTAGTESPVQVRQGRENCTRVGKAAEAQQLSPELRDQAQAATAPLTLQPPATPQQSAQSLMADLAPNQPLRYLSFLLQERFLDRLSQSSQPNFPQYLQP